MLVQREDQVNFVIEELFLSEALSLNVFIKEVLAHFSIDKVLESASNFEPLVFIFFGSFKLFMVRDGAVKVVGRPNEEFNECGSAHFVVGDALHRTGVKVASFQVR